MITILILISTALISFLSFQRPDLLNRLSFRPYTIHKDRDYLRFVSHIFVHADWIHLIVNMLVFLSFGRNVERIFQQMQENQMIFSGSFFYLILYFGGGILASLSSFLKHRRNSSYTSVGASGAVSAVLFTSIFFSPLDRVYFYGILPIPGIIFGVLYLFYSSYMGRKGGDNIDHDAHFWGAVFGFVFPVLLQPSLIHNFLNQF